MEAIPQDIVACHDENDRIPFDEWLDTLGDKTQAIVMNRIDRLEQGNFGDVKAVGGGVSELRIDYGPGYRVYFGRIGHVVHLIRGGDKSSQDGDIKQAKNFWTDHEDEKDNLL